MTYDKIERAGQITDSFLTLLFIRKFAVSYAVLIVHNWGASHNYFVMYPVLYVGPCASWVVLGIHKIIDKHRVATFVSKLKHELDMNMLTKSNSLSWTGMCCMNLLGKYRPCIQTSQTHKVRTHCLYRTTTPMVGMLNAEG